MQVLGHFLHPLPHPLFQQREWGDMMFFFKVKILAAIFENFTSPTQVPRTLIFERGPAKSSKFKIIRMNGNFARRKGMVGM